MDFKQSNVGRVDQYNYDIIVIRALGTFLNFFILNDHYLFHNFNPINPKMYYFVEYLKYLYTYKFTLK